MTFYMGAAGLGSAQVNSAGTATFSISTLPVGTDAIDGVFSGFGPIANSMSNTLSEVVSPPNIATAPTSTAGPGNVVLFGGLGTSGQVFSDTWIWDGSSWSLVHPLHSPPARYDAAIAYDAANNDDVLFGGMNSSGLALNDTWLWDGSDWQEVMPATSPSSRFAAVASASPTIQVHALTGALARSAVQGSAAEPVTADVVLFGGQDESLGSLGDTWAWTGATWAKLSLDPSPPPRAWAMAAPELNPPAFAQPNGGPGIATGSKNQPQRYSVKSVVLFGGQSTSVTDLSDTWVFNGQAWVPQQPINSPSPRVQAAMASLPETLPSTSPADKNSHAHDQSSSILHAVVLFGGHDGSGNVFSDTWIWRDENWVRLSAAGGPGSGNESAVATIDATLGKTIMVGGNAAKGQPSGDTWAIDSNTWNLVAHGAGAPGAPSGVSAVASDHQATVSWSAPASDNGDPVTSYTVTAEPGGATQTVTGCPAPLSATVSGLGDGTGYKFTVTATNAAGTSSASQASASVIPVGPPTVPSNVIVTVGDAKATLSWAAPDNDGAPIASYGVTVTPPCTSCAGLGVTGSPPATTTTVSGLTNGTAYQFSVSATNANGTGPSSLPTVPETPTNVVGPPGPPQDLHVAPGDGQLSVTFSPPASDGGSAITSYEVVPEPVSPGSSPSIARQGGATPQARPHHSKTHKVAQPAADRPPHEGHQESPGRSGQGGATASVQPETVSIPSRNAAAGRDLPGAFSPRNPGGVPSLAPPPPPTRDPRISPPGVHQSHHGDHHGHPKLHPHNSSTTSWEIATVAGGIGGPGQATQIGQTPSGVAVAPQSAPYPGTIYEVDSAHNIVRAIAPSGFEYALAGNGSQLYCSLPSLQALSGPASQVALNHPASVAVDLHGNVFIADSGCNALFMVAGQNCLASCPFGLASMIPGDIYVLIDPWTNDYFPPGATTATPANLNLPQALALDQHGNVLVALADGNNDVRVLASQSCSTSCPYGLVSMTLGDMYEVAGNGTAGYSGDSGPATRAELNAPAGVAVDPTGDIFISDHANAVVRMVAAATCASSCSYGLVSTVAGDIYTVAGNGTAGYLGDAGKATLAEIENPSQIALDPSGNLFITDPGNSRIRLLAAENCSSTCPLGLSSMTPGDIYTVAGNGIAGFAGDSSPASHAEVYGPAGVATDSTGNLLIGDSSNNRVRLVAAGTCSTGCPSGLASIIAGDIYTLAGNGTASFSGDNAPAGAAQLSNPWDVVSDPQGDTIIADSGNLRVRMVAASDCSANCPFGLPSTSAGDIYTIAGNGVAAFAGDGGPAIFAELAIIFGQDIAVDPSGNLVISDTNNDRIRVVARASCNTSCPYGASSMKAGYIYTVAGGGTVSGTITNETVNNVPALSSLIAAPWGVAVDAAGNIYAATGNQATLMVAEKSCSNGCPLGLSQTTPGYTYLVAGNYTCWYGSATFCQPPAVQPGTPATATAFTARGLAVDPHGDLVISTYVDGYIYLVANENCYSSCPYGLSSTLRGDIYVIGGNGGQNPFVNAAPATQSGIVPWGIGTDSNGDLLGGDNQLVVLIADHTCSAGCTAGLSSMLTGDAYVVAGTLGPNGYGAYGSAGDDGPATSAQFEQAVGVAFDSLGDVLVADSSTGRIRKVFPPSTPAISNVSPASGPTSGNTQVTIRGVGLTGVDKVSFGTTASTSFSVLSDTEISALSPGVTTTGAVDITVQSYGGTSAISPGDSFTYIASQPAPSVSAVSPVSTSTSGGATITITGTNFDNASGVDFGTTPASSFTFVSSNEILAVAPAMVAGVVDVTVTTPGGTSATSSADKIDFVVAPPTLSALSVTSGPYFGGTALTISGTGFAKATVVNFGPNPAASFNIVSDTEIVASSPAGSGTVDVQVLNPGGFSQLSQADKFTYVPAPTVTGLLENQGITTGGTTIDLRGTALSGVTSVMFGTIRAESFAVVSDTDLSVVTPPGTGTVDVTVTSPSGTSSTSIADQFIYVAPPTVTGVSPAYGAQPGGDAVIVTGTNFYSISKVTFGSTVVNEGLLSNGQGFTITTESPTQLKVITPPGSGTVDITVTNLVATSPVTSADRFTYLAPATVTSASPSFVSNSVGTQVTIMGTNLLTTSAITLYPSSGAQIPVTSFTVVSDTKVTATIPADRFLIGEVLLAVTTAGGPNNTGYPIFYTQAIAPPASGSTSSSTTITNLTPKSVYNVCVVAVNQYGTSQPTCTSNGTIVLNLTAPSVTSVSPSAGSAQGGTTVTIMGSHLSGATQVHFGPNPASKVQLISDSELIVTSPWGSEGAVDVTVTTSQGTSSATDSDEFTYPEGAFVSASSVPGTSGFFTVTSGGYVQGAGTAGSCCGDPNHPRNMTDPVSGIASSPDGSGYWLVTEHGTVFAYGDAVNSGGPTGLTGSPSVAGITAASPSGYWIALTNGQVESFGGAPPLGSLSSISNNAGIVAITATNDRGGYWLLDDWGRVYAFGDAHFYGSLSETDNGVPVRPSSAVVGIASTPDNLGYWIADQYGDVYPFGGATYFGSVRRPNAPFAPIVAVSSSSTSNGYRLISTWGNVYTFGNIPSASIADPLAISDTSHIAHAYYPPTGFLFPFQNPADDSSTSNTSPDPWTSYDQTRDQGVDIFGARTGKSFGAYGNIERVCHESPYDSDHPNGVPDKAPLLAAVSGNVVQIGANGFGIQAVAIQVGPGYTFGPSGNNAAQFVYYGHVWGTLVSKGDHVNQGQLITYIGCGPGTVQQQQGGGFGCLCGVGFSNTPHVEIGVSEPGQGDNFDAGGTTSEEMRSTLQMAPRWPLNPSTATVSIVTSGDGRGYWTVNQSGYVAHYGNASFWNDAGPTALARPMVGMASTVDHRGYWLVASDGGIFTFGDAGFFGSAGNLPLQRPIVGMAATPHGGGYWLVASDGGIFTFGDAGFFGSAGNLPLQRPIVGMAATPHGGGYWLVASDGGIFTFGDAGFYGSAGGIHLAQPIVGMAATPDAKGYWLAASDGGIFTFGDAGFYGSAVGNTGSPVVSIADTPDGGGYWLVTTGGLTLVLGDASCPSDALSAQACI